jgi:hypothetical protein
LGNALQEGFGRTLLELREGLVDELLHGGLLRTERQRNGGNEDEKDHAEIKN